MPVASSFGPSPSRPREARITRGLALAGLTMLLYGCGGGGGGSSPAAASPPSSSATAAAVATPTPSASASSVAVASPTPAPATASDFQPPTGAQPGAEAEAPGSFRIQSARSTDGLTFVPTGTIISDQANVPDMAVDASGRIWLYYTGGQVGTRDNTVAVAVSSDRGASWTYRYVNVPDTLQHAGDPDVILLGDGTWRMFLTTHVGTNIGVVCLESANGIDFSLVGTAFSSPGHDLHDSTTYRVGNTWHILTLQDMQPTQRHGTSSDGRSFVVGDTLPFKVNGEDFIASNPVPIDGGLRMYGFVPVTHEIHSFTSTDGANWTLEPGVRLAPSGTEIKDPAVVRLADGTWLMVYVARI